MDRAISTSDRTTISMTSTSANPAEVQTIVIKERPYRSYLDEKYFYTWLESLDDVVAVRGTADGLCIDLRDKVLSRSGAYDLLALLARYSYPLIPVRPHIDPGDLAYFRDPRAYWFDELFGNDGQGG
jgi:hypothetical protein